MMRNTKQAAGAKSRNVQSGNMRNKAGSNYVYHKTTVPKKLKRMRDMVVSQCVTPVQAQLVNDTTVEPPKVHHKRHRLVDPMAYASLHNKLLAEITARSSVNSMH